MRSLLRCIYDLPITSPEHPTTNNPEGRAAQRRPAPGKCRPLLLPFCKLKKMIPGGAMANSIAPVLRNYSAI